MLKNKIPLLESKIINLEQVNSNWNQIDSIRSTQIDSYKQELVIKDEEINNLKKSINANKKVTKGSIIVTIILALLCVLK